MSSLRLSELVKEIGRRLSPRNRKIMMEQMGYVTHPALPDGRATSTIFQEGQKRPTLYVLRDSIPALNITDGGEALAAYMKAQGYIPTGASTNEVQM